MNNQFHACSTDLKVIAPKTIVKKITESIGMAHTKDPHKVPKLNPKAQERQFFLEATAVSVVTFHFLTSGDFNSTLFEIRRRW